VNSIEFEEEMVSWMEEEEPNDDYSGNKKGTRCTFVKGELT
jgi:hypothetical protein